jgi:hypothetical protein
MIRIGIRIGLGDVPSYLAIEMANSAGNVSKCEMAVKDAKTQSTGGPSARRVGGAIATPPTVCNPPPPQLAAIIMRDQNYKADRGWIPYHVVHGYRHSVAPAILIAA